MTAVTATLSERLREETRQDHEDAEHSVFMGRLLDGSLDAAAFTALQEQAYLFYSALEGAVDACSGDARLGAVADRLLDRRAALRADLGALGGTVDAVPLDETASYVAELQRIGRERDVPALIAHHYTRYLGDLAGGQVIGRLMGRHYGVPESATAFYRFPHIDKPKRYRDAYRAALDAMDLGAGEREHLLASARAAFAYNSGVFGGLDRALGISAGGQATP
ncbi:MAG: heme oxygenase (biliverdin-producing) [Corynebacterium sp.]|uniref:biliverdin-producing heme oxygenase n=1 Tax=Corynebacterium sp. TaxID=1720 RepID=UPI003F99AF5D